MTAPSTDQMVEQVPVNSPWCPCCGDDTWCPAEVARSAADAARAPEVVMGVGTYGTGRWDR